LNYRDIQASEYLGIKTCYKDGRKIDMKKILISLLASTLLSASALSVSAPALSQETLVIDGKEVTRVIIAPARTSIARIIRVGLYDDYKSSKFESRQYYEKQKLFYFYGARHFEPLWLSQDNNGNPVFSAKAREIIDVFKNSAISGLNPNDYLGESINIDNISTDPISLAQLETAFSAATMRYASDSYGGRIDPRSVSNNIDYKPNKINQNEILLELAKSDNPRQVLLNLEPKHREFIALKNALAQIGKNKTEEIIQITGGKILRLGDTDERVPLLRERFSISLPNVGGNVYDEGLLAEVENFQSGAGLKVDGVIGPATIAAMNGNSHASREDIIANMERWRWIPRDLGDFHVFVNIPQYQLNIMKSGNSVFSTRVVVGKPKFATAIFSDNIKHVVVNPYWNVPRSILNNEIAPLVKKNPNYLSAKNMQLLSGGKVIDATSIDWSSTSMNGFRVRQLPGANNALGSVKFLFPNKHAIYLHDTPSKSLFSRSTRAFSHGCVRVKNPWDFAEALLQFDSKLNYKNVSSQRGNNRGEKWNNLGDIIPVHLAYFTLRIDKSGNIRSYSDVYGHNKRLKSLLGL